MCTSTDNEQTDSIWLIQELNITQEPLHDIQNQSNIESAIQLETTSNLYEKVPSAFKKCLF